MADADRQMATDELGTHLLFRGAAATVQPNASPHLLPRPRNKSTTAYVPLPQLALEVVGLPNPQRNWPDGRVGESRMLDWLGAWFAARGIPFSFDPSWGIHAVLTSAAGAAGTRDGAEGERGVLLSGHLDSDHLDLAALPSLRLSSDGAELRFDGEVGLDDKSGVAVALSVLERLRVGGDQTTPWSLHVLFTVGEESGQKGAVRAPVAALIGGRVRYAIVIDRMTGGRRAPTGRSGKPLRHVVGTYKGVRLHDGDSWRTMHGHLRAAAREVGEADGEARVGRGCSVSAPPWRRRVWPKSAVVV